ncbi:MAG: YciI family protein [Flavipsychrobacter sp.]
MKYIICFLFSLTIYNTAVGQNKTEKTFKDGEYTMKQYYFVMLTKGERRNEITDTAIINKLQAGHLANIGKLAKEGKILVAGPFGDDGNWRGIFIFDCERKEEVEQLLNTDPAIAAGRLAYEIHPWWTAKNAVFK